MTGKEKCEILKSIRRRIADENQIPFQVPECPYTGECPDTCPRCEAELEFLTSQIADKEKAGASVRLDGLCEDMVRDRHARNESLPARNFAERLADEPDGKYPLLSMGRLRLGRDGQGITTLVGGAGCPLRCTWCVNRDLLQHDPQWVSAGELLTALMRDDLYFRATGGGVTFGGGEPLLHSAFIRQFRRICPAQWRITVETSLAVPERNMCELLDVVDSFIVDCKSMNRRTYTRYTGAKMAAMRSNLRLLVQEVGPDRIVVRVPVIPTYNTRWETLRSIQQLKRMGIRKIDPFVYTVV